MAAYAEALGQSLTELRATKTWRSGLHPRMVLADDPQRETYDNEAIPKLTRSLKPRMTSLIQMHNSFAGLHPALSPLERTRTDPIERKLLVANRALMQETVEALSGQARPRRRPPGRN